jgi:hypothetical protein
MFRFNHHHQGVYYLSLLKLLLLKQTKLSVKIHQCGQFGSVAAHIIRSAIEKHCVKYRKNRILKTNEWIKISWTYPDWCMSVTLFVLAKVTLAKLK